MTLNAPSGDPQLQELRANYLGQVSELLAAARWADNPFSKIDCNLDLDADGQNECILANESYFAILDPSGARLTNLFFLDDAGPHQLIGPSSQFTVGLSDSSEWRLANGEGADPMVIPGAFADDSETWTQYTASLTEEGVIFTSPNGERIKSYRLLENGVEARYQLSGAVSAQVPLAIGAQNFFLGPTDYLPSLAVHSWTWSLLNGIGVEVRTEAMLSAQGYTSTVPFLGMPEDPNLGYPQGSYLPFPLSVVTINGSDNFSVQIINK